MNDIKKLQQFDSLSEAEKITTKSYKEDKATGFLGMALQMENSKKINKLLDASDDTKFSETESEYLRKVTNFGFEVILKDPFINKDGVEERFYILWHNEYSILMCFDTFTFGNDGSFAKSGEPVPEPSRNSGKIYYTWIPENIEKLRMGLTSSGGCTTNVKPDFSEILEFTEPKPEYNSDYETFKKDLEDWNNRADRFREENNLKIVWQGDHDCREAVKNNINLLAENGTFLKTWLKTPFLWLLHYMDSKSENYDYESITKSRIERLPEHVQKSIAFIS